jgi:hypothetical protein
MGYIDDYNKRKGKCEYCKHHNYTGSHRCAECYGTAFEDSVDLLSFIRAKVTKDATNEFNESEEGKRLYNMMEQHRQTYNQCKDSYNQARDKFVDEAIRQFEDKLNLL